MATVIGNVMMSHVPAIGGAIARGVQHEPYWKPWFDGFAPVHRWLEQARPDVVVMIYNDHGLNFFLDKLPTFAIGAAPEYRNADEGWGIPTVPPFRGHEPLSWHLIEALVGDEFDMTTCQEMLVDHAFTLPMAMLWPQRQGTAHDWPVRTVPVCINTVQFPLPSMSRCFRLGRSIGRAIESFPEDLRVLVMGTGGLSHQLDGTRAGFINKSFDALCMDKLVAEPEALTGYASDELVELAGTQGVEVMNWLAARGAVLGEASLVHSNYHIPISNTAAGLLALEQRRA